MSTQSTPATKNTNTNKVQRPALHVPSIVLLGRVVNQPKQSAAIANADAGVVNPAQVNRAALRARRQAALAARRANAVAADANPAPVKINRAALKIRQIAPAVPTTQQNLNTSTPSTHTEKPSVAANPAKTVLAASMKQALNKARAQQQAAVAARKADVFTTALPVSATSNDAKKEMSQVSKDTKVQLNLQFIHKGLAHAKKIGNAKKTTNNKKATPHQQTKIQLQEQRKNVQEARAKFIQARQHLITLRKQIKEGKEAAKQAKSQLTNAKSKLQSIKVSIQATKMNNQATVIAPAKNDKKGPVTITELEKLKKLTAMGFARPKLNLRVIRNHPNNFDAVVARLTVIKEANQRKNNMVNPCATKTNLVA